jgi:hypothetical protein
MQTIQAQVIADSRSPDGVRLTTLQLVYPRFVHAEFMTHRVFSRNASSSRAIPVAKMIEQVRTDPAMPVHWGKNQPGMQAREEHDALIEVPWIDIEVAGHKGHPMFEPEDAWREAAKEAARIAEAMAKAGYHKQVVNRILEPYQWMHTVVTATEWNNFFELRAHPDAQPEIQALAQSMLDAFEHSVPVAKRHGEWHLPYVRPEELEPGGAIFEWTRSQGDPFTERAVLRTAVRCSTARCARVSFLRHDGLTPLVEEDQDLYARLVGSKPIHASPSEHQAQAVAGMGNAWSGNLRGWVQHRKLIERGEEFAA